MSADRSLRLGLCLLVSAALLVGCSSQNYEGGYLRESPYQDDTLSPDLSTRGAGGEGTAASEASPEPAYRADEEDRTRPRVPKATSDPDTRQEEKEDSVGETDAELERIATSPATGESDDQSKDRKQRFQEAMRLVEAFEYEKARPMLSKLAGEYENAGQVPAAAQCLFWAAYCYEKSQSDPEAISLYRRVVNDYAQTRSARTARQRLDALTDE